MYNRSVWGNNTQEIGEVGFGFYTAYMFTTAAAIVFSISVIFYHLSKIVKLS